MILSWTKVLQIPAGPQRDHQPDSSAWSVNALSSLQRAERCGTKRRDKRLHSYDRAKVSGRMVHYPLGAVGLLHESALC